MSIKVSQIVTVSIPKRKGTGASSTSVIFFGKMGINTCFQHSGNKNEIKAIAACVSKDLCSEIKRTFFSRRSAINISMTYSASKALNRYSMSAFYKSYKTIVT